MGRIREHRGARNLHQPLRHAQPERQLIPHHDLEAAVRERRLRFDE
jgi:hypothetical protein